MKGKFWQCQTCQSDLKQAKYLDSLLKRISTHESNETTLVQNGGKRLLCYVKCVHLIRVNMEQC